MRNGSKIEAFLCDSPFAPGVPVTLKLDYSAFANSLGIDVESSFASTVTSSEELRELKVVGDHARIIQVVRNLISNAIKVSFLQSDLCACIGSSR